MQKGVVRVNAVNRNVLDSALRNLLDPTHMADYCPNGLQVEGGVLVRKLITGVTASLALIELAVAQGADAILVHHGLMWKGDPQILAGFRKARLQKVLGANLNVFAYHLPLDKHPVLGNNVQLGALLAWPTDQVVGEKGLVHVGRLGEPKRLGELLNHISGVLGAPCRVAGQQDLNRTIQTVAWCTGGAASYVEQAAVHGADLYLTGELSEPAVHVASELNVSLVGAGHHATERCGVHALGLWVASQYGIEVVFQDLFVDV